MKIFQIHKNRDNTEAILGAIEVLKQGGVIVYPTDTIYGLGANACDIFAVEQVFKIKNRSFSKPLPIIARNLKWVKEMASLTPKVENILSQIWPGPISVILNKKNIIPNIVTADKSNIAIRIPDYDLTDKIMARYGYPLTATSANLSGEEGTGDIKKVIESFKGQVWKPDLVLDAGVLPESLPSTILDLTTFRPKILRIGPSKPDFLMQLLGATYDNKKINSEGE